MPGAHFGNLHTSWFTAVGPLIDTVISSRVRLARNLAGYCFPQRASVAELENVIQTTVAATKQTEPLKTAIPILLEYVAKLDRQFLLERHLISQEHSKTGRHRAVVVSENELISVMINEEDHLRLQCISPGFSVKTAWQDIDALDNELAQYLNYAVSANCGYLTACPTNVGTGIRASVMLHLPALVMTKQIEKVLQSVAQLGLAIRGLYGEGSEAFGDLYQISNQTTLGQSEETIVTYIENYAKQIIGREQTARVQLQREARNEVEDAVYRAYGILRNARLISARETLNLLSHLRLGVNLGWIELPLATINELMIITQPAHLQRLYGKELDSRMRDIIRAEIIREKLIN
ncbi:MAG: protein arginine kinase [bacterium]|nr:protein arginine kinase [bacterium]